jgi:type III secretion HrpO family protein
VLSPATLAAAASQALMLAVAISLPVVGVAALVGIVTAALQAATQVQDSTLAHLPRLLAVSATLVLLGPWMGGQVVTFATRLLLSVH